MLWLKLRVDFRCTNPSLKRAPPFLIQVLSLPLSSGSSNVQDRSRLQVPLNLSPSLEMKIVFFDHALLKYNLTQAFCQFIATNPNQKRSSCSLPLHIRVLIARVERQHLFGPIWQDSNVSVTYITIFTDQSHIMSLFPQHIKIICIKSSEINVGKLCQPNNVQTGPSSKFNWTTPRGKVVFNWSPTVGDQLNPTYHIVRTFITTITDSISDLIQVLLWNDIDSCLKWSLLIIPLGEDTEDPVEGGKKG